MRRFLVPLAVAASVLTTAVPAHGATSAEREDHSARPKITSTRRHGLRLFRAAAAATSNRPLVYNGGRIIGSPKVYVVFWGSQWTNRDPDGERPVLLAFYKALSKAGGDDWSTITTQFCDGVTKGVTTCPASARHIALPTSSPLAGSWDDGATAAPTHPSQAQLAAEAIRAGQHFGLTAKSALDAQIVIATAKGNSSDGFGTQYCAWHAAATSADFPSLAYTNLPYTTDAGRGCGAGLVNGATGRLDGVTMVAGHEYAETITDPVPPTGWVDNSGAENADKCAWIMPGKPGGARNATLGGRKFAVQGLWSNNLTPAGGCVNGYTDPAHQQR